MRLARDRRIVHDLLCDEPLLVIRVRGDGSLFVATTDGEDCDIGPGDATELAEAILDASTLGTRDDDIRAAARAELCRQLAEEEHRAGWEALFERDYCLRTDQREGVQVTSLEYFDRRNREKRMRARAAAELKGGV